MVTKGDQTSTASSSSALPSYAAPDVTNFLNMANTAATQPYTANPNQQVAGTTADTNTANQQIEGIAAAGTPSGLTSAQNTLQGIAGYQPTSVLNANLSAYMNPYTQDSIDVQQQQATQQYNQQQSARDASAVSAGAFGGDRATVANSIAQQDLNTNLQNIESTGLNTAYNNATQLFQNDQSNQLQANQLGISAANAEGSLATDADNIGLSNAAALSGVGAQQQTQAQNVLNATNAQWTAQNQYPATQAALYSQLLNGTWQPQTTTATTTPAPSLLSQIAGAAGAVVGGVKAFSTP